MNSIDALNASLNFNVAASVSAQTQKTKEKDKTSKGKAVSFSSALEKEIAVNELNEAGLPLEILGLSQEKAVEYLQDQIDLSADRLDENFSAENFAGFRKSVSQFMRYLEKNNFEVTKLKRPGKPRTVRGLSPFFQREASAGSAFSGACNR